MRVESLELKVKDLKYQDKTKVGNIKPKEVKRIEIPITASEYIKDGEVQFKIQALEANKFHSDPVLLSFETRKLKEPNLKIVSVGIDEIASVIKNGKIDLGEAIEVKVVVQNTGEGKARDVKVDVISDDNNIYLTSKKDFILGDMDSGDYKEIGFSFSITKEYSGDKILPIYLNLNEKRQRFSKLKEIYESLNELRAKRIYVVLDSCFSGAGILPEGVAPINIEIENIALLSDKMIIWTSSSETEYSLANFEKKHRLFSYYFMKGLKGDADTDGDGKITAYELYIYTKERVGKDARRQNQIQTPQVVPGEEVLREKKLVIR